MTRYKALYRRHGITETVEYDSLDDAIIYLQVGGEQGELFALGVYDTQDNSIHLPNTGMTLYRLLAAVTMALGLNESPSVAGSFEQFCDADAYPRTEAQRGGGGGFDLA